MKRLINWVKLAFLSFFLSFQARSAWASACCARSAAAPFLLMSEDQAQFSMSLSSSKQLTELEGAKAVPSKLTQKQQASQVLLFSGSFLLSDRWQLGLGIPVQSSMQGGDTAKASQSFMELGDLRLTTAYEILPEWTFSEWLPLGFVFFGLSIPTQVPKSCCDASLRRAYLTPSLGSFFIKRWEAWDAFFISEGHYSVPQVIESQRNTMRVWPGLGASAGLGAGFSPGGGDWRFGLRFQLRMDAITARQDLSDGRWLKSNQPGPWVSSTDLGIDVSYLIDRKCTLMLSYTDQTLLPALATNTNLNQSIAFNLQYRWER